MTTASRILSGLTGLLFIGLCWLAACTSVRFQESLDDYQGFIARYESRLNADSNDVEALRELGVIYMRTNHPRQAQPYLSEAYSRDAEDPKTRFYLGLASESVGDQEFALRLYEQYPQVSQLSPYRRLMKARYQWVVRRIARTEMQAQMQKPVGQLPVASNVVAVFPLSYQHDDEDYALLGRGLAEMLMLDLANVNSLRVVERVRLQALRDELELAQSPYIDSTTAPRMGQWLGAGRLVGGTYTVLAGDRLRLDAVLVEVESGRVEGVEGGSGAIESVFRLEKTLVFNLIDEMGVTLTPEERERIELIPTQNVQAFLAFSRGLQAEDEGSYEEAMRYYRQAQAEDPDFQEVGDRIDAVEGVSDATGNAEEAIGEVIQIILPPGTEIDLVDDLTLILNEGIGSPIVPGQDAREPAVDPVITLQAIPDPSPPPSGQGGNQ